MRGHTDDRGAAENSARRRRVEIVLPHVHAVGRGQLRDVGAIVHDDDRARLVRALHDILAHAEELAARRVLASDLNEAGAAREVRVGQRGHRPSRPASHLVVDDGVERGQVQTASARFLSLSVAGAKRSMNFVLNRPARKSGSFRMRRCIGIVVLTPSTTDISSARFMRTIAS